MRDSTCQLPSRCGCTLRLANCVALIPRPPSSPSPALPPGAAQRRRGQPVHARRRATARHHLAARGAARRLRRDPLGDPPASRLLPPTLSPSRGPSRGPSPSPDPSPSPSPSPNPDQVIDRLDGTFLVTYVAGLSGRYLIALTLRGEPLRGSPLAVHVPLEDPTTPRATLVRSASLRDGMRDVVWGATQAGGSPLVARDGAGGTFYVLD